MWVLYVLRSFIRIILHIYFINGGVQLSVYSDGRFAFSWSKSEVTRGDRTESCLIVVNDQRITTRLVNIMTEVYDAPISRKSDETLSIQLSARSSPSYENGRLRVGWLSRKTALFLTPCNLRIGVHWWVRFAFTENFHCGIWIEMCNGENQCRNMNVFKRRSLFCTVMLPGVRTYVGCHSTVKVMAGGNISQL